MFGNKLAGLAFEQGDNPTVEHCCIHDHHGSGFVSEDGLGTVCGCDPGVSGTAGLLVERRGAAHLDHCCVHSSQQAGVSILEGSHWVLARCEVSANALAGLMIGAGGWQCRTGRPLPDEVPINFLLILPQNSN